MAINIKLQLDEIYSVFQQNLLANDHSSSIAPFQAQESNKEQEQQEQISNKQTQNLPDFEQIQSLFGNLILEWSRCETNEQLKNVLQLVLTEKEISEIEFWDLKQIIKNEAHKELFFIFFGNIVKKEKLTKNAISNLQFLQKILIKSKQNTGENFTQKNKQEIKEEKLSKKREQRQQTEQENIEIQQIASYCQGCTELKKNIRITLTDMHTGLGQNIKLFD